MGQHQDMPPPQVDHRVIQSGPISLAPESKPLFEEAVLNSGGQLVPVSPDTKGLVWLSEKNADDLMAILRQYPTIEWVQLPWAGVDAFATVLAYLATQPEDQRPVVTSAKGAYSEPVAEHALALMLACMRELPSKARDAFWQPERTGLSVFGRHIVLVGAGGVGRAFLDVVRPFRPTITVVRRQNVPVAGADNTITPEVLPQVLPHADALVIAAAATESTEHFVGKKELALMPAHSVLVNIARGSLVDVEAVVDAVAEGRLFGAGLDVMDPEPFPNDHRVWSESRIVITSHSADTPVMTQPLLAERVEKNVTAFLSGTTLFGVVDVEAGY